jgi:nucleotide-binding universal stress UspA family protein
MKVLIAVQEKSNTLLEFVTNHHWGDDVELHVVHAVELVAGTMPGFYGNPDVLNALTSYGKEVTAFAVQHLRQAFPNAKIEISSPTGSPAGEILHTAAEWGADAIVMGTHGRSALGRVFMGSVSLDVVSRAECDVYVVASRRSALRAAA